MSFADDVKKWEQKALLAANAATCKVFEELSTSAVELSPTHALGAKYSQGQLKNQWYAAVGPTPSTAITAATSDSGADSLARIKASIAQKPFFGKDNILTLANNTEQAYYAEVLGWKPGEGTNGWVWSNDVKPYRMVALSVAATKGKYM